MTSKKILMLYLFIAMILVESLMQSACSSPTDGDEREVSGQKTADLSVQAKRAKRSPCIVGTRWRTRRCRKTKGKRSLATAKVRFFNT